VFWVTIGSNTNLHLTLINLFSVAIPKLVCVIKFPHTYLLHTRPKGRNHEIVRAQKKVSEGRPKSPPKSCSVVTYSQV
jgi:hypothetical protein